MKRFLIIFAVFLMITACGDESSPSDSESVNDSNVNESSDMDNYVPDSTVKSDNNVDPMNDNEEGVSDEDMVGVPNDIGTMVEVPAGPFMMGCDYKEWVPEEPFEPYCETNEQPMHEVTLSAYSIDKYEVTVREYEECIVSGICNNDNEDEPYYNLDSGSHYVCNISDDTKKDHPMNCVTWYGAKAYCEWLGKHLPTEAQWEKAARSDDSRLFPWGNEPYQNCDYAIVGDYKNEQIYYGCGENSTWIVGSREKGKSPYGAYDMIGNVSEWVNDWYAWNYYENSPSEDPTGPESGETRGVRGGSWIYGNYDNGAGIFSYHREHSGVPDGFNAFIGFRCAK